MSTRLTTVAALAVAAAPLAVAAAPVAQAQESCVPTISMDKPYQAAGGTAVFPASFTLCEGSRVTVKFRDRDNPAVAGSGSGSHPAGPGTTAVGSCHPDGLAHRYAAYATVKTTTGTLLAKSATVYLKTKPVTRNCAPWPPAEG